jgi:hypothetical protein
MDWPITVSEYAAVPFWYIVIGGAVPFALSLEPEPEPAAAAAVTVTESDAGWTTKSLSPALASDSVAARGDDGPGVDASAAAADTKKPEP